jgi:putative tricarboxylic transport membrane protein
MIANRLMAVVIGLCALAYLWGAYQIPTFPIPRPVDSDAFPKMLGFVLLGLSVWLFFDSPAVDPHQTDGKQAHATNQPTAWIQWKPVLFTAFAIAVYAALLDVMGFVLASALLAASLTLYYGYRRHTVNAVVSVLVPLVLYLLMTRLMNIHLPAGWLPF